MDFFHLTSGLTRGHLGAIFPWWAFPCAIFGPILDFSECTGGEVENQQGRGAPLKFGCYFSLVGISMRLFFKPHIGFCPRV